MSFEKSIAVLTNLNKKYQKSEMNESDTRFQIIDKVIKHTFFWPDSNVRTETHTNEGYTDYQLTDKGKTYLVIEAKKEKIRFNFSQYEKVVNNKIKVKLLMKDKNAKKTIEQVKNYCNDIGCNYACITNGHEWAFFRTYIEGKSWLDGDAYIISSLESFIENFNEINNYFTYNKIVKGYAFKKLFDGIEYSSNERYESKLQINGYSEQIDNNHIETQIRGYFDRYFGEIRIDDRELLERCYVAERGYTLNFDKVTHLLIDALSPYMREQKMLQNIHVKGEENRLSQEIVKVIVEEKKAKVLILFGGKGAGKTTFLVSLFNSEKNRGINNYSVIGHVNLLKIANDKEAIKKEILSQLITKLDVDNVLNGTNEELVRLFKDRFNIELKQSLDGLDPKSETFIVKRNELLKSYKEDTLYSLECLAEYLREQKRAIIINIDNTDQFDQDLQDYCFSLASELSEKLHSISIISLREERYVTSSIEGYLDAYEKNGFHISSPNPQQVFLKRLNFIQGKINSEKKVSKRNKLEINRFFKTLKYNLELEDSEFNKFMTAATHGNIRQGLELFRNFIFSHYTNVNEMIKQEHWYITLHQILKPIMIPIYRFYDEKTSNSIPNIFRLRSEHNSSHFTAYRILKKLAIKNDIYISIYELKSHFIETFNMEDDFLLNIDILLKRGMIESENGLDKYDEKLQKVKISSFGYYMQDTIFRDFTYLELIASDLAVLDKQVSNQIVHYSNEDYRLLKQGEDGTISKKEQRELRYKRIKIRLSKVNKFCDYLEKQEALEVKRYDLNKEYMITKKIRKNYDIQRVDILESAKKNLNIVVSSKEENRHGIRKL
jgi:hypothetical protein